MKIKQIEDIKISSPEDSQVIVYNESDKKFENGATISANKDANTIASRNSKGQLLAETGIDVSSDANDKYQVVNKDYLKKKNYASPDTITNLITGDNGIKTEVKEDPTDNVEKVFITAKVDNKSIIIDSDGNIASSIFDAFSPITNDKIDEIVNNILN